MVESWLDSESDRGKASLARDDDDLGRRRGPKDGDHGKHAGALPKIPKLLSAGKPASPIPEPGPALLFFAGSLIAGVAVRRSD